jgi:hypothetical protein
MARIREGVAVLWLVAGCNFSGGGLGSGQSSEPGETSMTGSGTGTTATPTSGSEGPGCEPGDEQGCTCDTGEGTQVCGQGGAFGACECPTTTTGPVEPTTSGGPTTSETTTTESSTSGSSTGEPMCVEIDEEPNDDPETEAKQHASVTCNDEAKPIPGTLARMTDVDWHFYVVNDSMQNGCMGGALTVTHTLTADAPVRLCVRPLCMSDTEAMVDCKGSEATQDPPGCCLGPVSDGVLVFSYDCAESMSEDVYMSVQVDMPDGDCVPYTVDYDVD